VWLYRKPLWQHRHYTLPSGLLFVLVLGYLFSFWISPQGMQRAQSTLTTDLTAIPGQYLSYFNPTFLFWRGDDNPRHSMLPMGQLHYIEVITVFIGLIGVIKSRHPHRRILYLWLLLYPIPASLTTSTHAIRAIMGAPIFAILSGYALHTLAFYFQSQSRLISACSSMGIVTSLVIFCTFYFIDYAKSTAYWWQYGLREAISITETYPYPCMIESAKPYGLLYIFILFYTRFPPDEYHGQRQYLKDGHWTGATLGKYTMATTPRENVLNQGTYLYIAGQGMNELLMQTGYNIQDLHEIEDPGGRGILLKILMTDGQKTQQGNPP
jgi:hypothetical protein